MTRMIIVLALFVVATLSGCDFMSHTHCEDKILVQEKSPDGKYVAILYHRSCANNTGLYTCVNLQETSETILSKTETQPVLTMKGVHDVTAVWSGPNSLEIKSAGLRDRWEVLTQESGWKTVNISYKD